MGVPSLYKWLTQKYPEIRIQVGREAEQTTDNLYLDFNAIIHPCCNKALENMQDTDTELYRNLEEFVDDVMGRIRPRRLLYVSIDGVAPRAKLNQQRARRFVHAKEVSEGGKFYFRDNCGTEPCKSDSSASDQGDVPVAAGGVFDTNAITPGTEFMQRLDLFLQEMISYKLSTDERWRNVDVIYSGYRIPGEGEQKIMEYIRKNQSTQHTAVIYSPDADLIFLGLTLYDHKIMIMREEQKRSVPTDEDSRAYLRSADKEYSLVDISRLRNLVLREFKASMKIPFDPRRILEDWILLCFSVGNDFLPSSPCFEIRTNALDKLTNILQTVYMRTRSFITDHGRINYDILREFFLECSARENQFIVEKRNNLVQTRQRMNIPYNPSEEFFLENERGKIRFYVEKMNIRSEHELLDACREYIKGLEWVYNYYFYEIPSWDWYYPYHFAPFMADLGHIKNISISFSKSRPLRPMEQLLAVLPPLSKDLLPECMHPVFGRLKDMYPTDFKLDMFQKCMDWQAVPILPFMDTREIVREFEERQSMLTFAESERNTAGYPSLFSCQPRVVAKIYPMYTDLKPYENIETDAFCGRAYPMHRIRHLDEDVDSYGFRYANRAVRFTFDQRRGHIKKSK